MRVLALFLSVIALACTGCETPEQTQERGLRVMGWYFDIPAGAEDIQALYFSEGQWRSAYLKFSVSEHELNEFLDTTCFGQMPPNSSGRYWNFKITSLYRGTPDWWLVDRTKLILEGSCTQAKESYMEDLGIGVTQTDNTFTIYINVFM